MADDKSNPFWRSPAYNAAEERRKLPRLLLGGEKGNATASLRASPLPWFPPISTKETLPTADGGTAPYQRRLDMITVEPFYEDAVLRVASTVLSEPVKLGTDVPVKFRGNEGEKDGYTENVNGKGDNLDVFLKPVVKDAAGEGGFSVVLVDFPEVEAGISEAEIQARDIRPYWSHYPACSVLWADPEYVDGREVCRELRLLDGCDDDGDELVRVLKAAPWNERTGRRDGFVTWEQFANKKGEDGKRTALRVKGGTMQPHQEIPAHPLYFTKHGYYDGVPGQALLADLNMAHTQFTLKIRRDLELTCGANATITGAKTPEEKAQRVWDDDVLLVFESDGAQAGWMERTGSGATAAMAFQERLEDKCRSYAKLPLVQRSGNLTATGQSIDAATAKTEVQALALAVKDFIERLLTLTAIYINRSTKDPRGGSVTVKIPAILRERDLDGLRELAQSNMDRGLPTDRTLLATMVAQGLGGIRDDLNIDEEIAGRDAAEGRKRAAIEEAMAKLKAQQAVTTPSMPDADMGAAGNGAPGGVQ